MSTFYIKIRLVVVNVYVYYANTFLQYFPGQKLSVERSEIAILTAHGFNSFDISVSPPICNKITSCLTRLVNRARVELHVDATENSLLKNDADSQ